MFHPQGPTFWELAHQALSSTRHGYDLLAPKFDYTPFRTPDDLLQNVVPFIAEEADLLTGLDVCCGTGAGMRMLRPVCKESVTGIDFSEPMLRVAQQQTATATGTATLEFIQGDVLKMPFQEAFDVAVCFGALGHFLAQDQPKLVTQVASALRTGGRFFLATSYLPPRSSRRYWLSRSFNAAVHLRNFLVYPPFVMFYLTFLVPAAIVMLEKAGFDVDLRKRVFPPPYHELVLVVATKK